MQLTLTVCLRRKGTSVPFVRHLIRSTLTTLGVVGSCVHDLELALSEACTNVLRHVSGSPDEYKVETHIEGGQARITVTDSGAGFAARTARVRAVPLTAEGGRGIHLMRALVDELSVLSDDRGTIVVLTKTLEFGAEPALGRPGASWGNGARLDIARRGHRSEG